MLFLQAAEIVENGSIVTNISREHEHVPESQSLFGDTNVAYAYGGIPTHQSCVAVGVANGVRGAMIGAAFGGVYAAFSTSTLGAGSSGTKLTYVGHAMARNAVAFGAWTSMYGFSRCQLIKFRRKNDVLNPAMAGAFTGAVLTLLTMPRMYWRFSSQQILHNAGGSALIAVAFDFANRV